MSKNIVTITYADISDEENAKRMERIKKAAADLIIAYYRANRMCERESSNNINQTK